MSASSSVQDCADSPLMPWSWLVRLAAIILPLALAFNVSLDMVLVDGFHEGEYLTNSPTMRMYYHGVIGFPILIHGAMDFLPALLAERVGGAERIILWTRLFNTACVAIGWVFWMTMPLWLLKNHRQRRGWYFAYSLVFLWFAFSTGTDVVAKQQAFIGTRDVFLVITMVCAARASTAIESRFAGVFYAFAGIAAGICLFWSYDRGVIALLCAISMTCVLVLRRNFFQAMLLIAGYIAAVLLVSSMRIAGTLEDNLFNIVYWLKNTSDVWYYAYRLNLAALPGAAATAVFALLVCIHAAIKLRQRAFGPSAPLALALLVAQLVLLSKLSQLPNYPSSYYNVWPSLLLLMVSRPHARIIDSLDQAIRSFGEHWTAGVSSLTTRYGERLAVFALVFMLFANSLVGAAFLGKRMMSVSDAQLIVARDWGLDEIDLSAAGCIFQWSNQGIFAFVAKRPFCTSYGYAVYASRAQEASLLSELESKPPPLIVFDNNVWTMYIYGRSMQKRLPLIDYFIRERYDIKRTRSGYVFAVLREGFSK